MTKLTADDLTTGTELVYQSPSVDYTNDRDYTEPTHGTIADVVDETKTLGPGNTMEQTLVVIETVEGEEVRVGIENLTGETDFRVGIIETVDEDEPEVVTDGGRDAEPQTTDDISDVEDVQAAETSGGYTVDGEDIAGTIYQAALANGGRVSVDPHVFVQGEGYAREVATDVYAPAPNPYHVAAAVVDEVHDDYGGEQATVDVYVEDTGAEIEQHLRATRLGYKVEQDDEDALEATLSVIRNHDPTDRNAHLRDELREAADVPDYVAARIENLFGPGDDLPKDDQSHSEKEAKSHIKRAADHPTDAWQHHLVQVSVHQEASNPDYV